MTAVPSESSNPQSMFFRLYSLAWPIIGLNVLSVLALAVDTAMCGHLPNKEQALSGLSYASQVIFLLMVGMIGLSVGTVASIARAKGAGNTERANHILYQSTILAAGLGIFIAIVGNLLARPMLSALGASSAAQDYGLQYLRPLLTATSFNYLFLLFAAVFRAVGNTRIPFLVSLLTNAINVLINYCLILGNWGFPALGLQGAAIGTLTSQAVGATLLGWMLYRGALPPISLRVRGTPIDRKTIAMLLRVGTPAALDMIIVNASFLSIVGMLGRIDEVAVAAHGIGLRIQALAFVPGMSVSQATGALVGQSLGAAKPDEARRVVMASIALCLVIMSVLALTLILLAHPIVRIFDVVPGTPLETYAVSWMRLLGYGMPLAGIYISFVGMLQGAGETKTSLRVNLITTFCFQIPLSYILGFVLGMGALGVWLAFPVAFVLKASAGFLIYRQGRWIKVGAHV